MFCVLHDIDSFSPGPRLVQVLEPGLTSSSLCGQVLLPGRRLSACEVVEIRRHTRVEPVVEILEELPSYFAEIFLKLIQILGLVLDRLA